MNGISGNGTPGSGTSRNGISGNGSPENGTSGNGISGNGTPENGTPENGSPRTLARRRVLSTNRVTGFNTGDLPALGGRVEGMRQRLRSRMVTCAPVPAPSSPENLGIDSPPVATPASPVPAPVVSPENLGIDSTPSSPAPASPVPAPVVSPENLGIDSTPSSPAPASPVPAPVVSPENLGIDSTPSSPAPASPVPAPVVSLENLGIDSAPSSPTAPFLAPPSLAPVFVPLSPIPASPSSFASFAGSPTPSLAPVPSSPAPSSPVASPSLPFSSFSSTFAPFPANWLQLVKQKQAEPARQRPIDPHVQNVLSSLRIGAYALPNDHAEDCALNSVALAFLVPVLESVPQDLNGVAESDKAKIQVLLDIFENPQRVTLERIEEAFSSRLTNYVSAEQANKYVVAKQWLRCIYHIVGEVVRSEPSRNQAGNDWLDIPAVVSIFNSVLAHAGLMRENRDILPFQLGGERLSTVNGFSEIPVDQDRESSLSLERLLSDATGKYKFVYTPGNEGLQPLTYLVSEGVEYELVTGVHFLGNHFTGFIKTLKTKDMHGNFVPPPVSKIWTEQLNTNQEPKRAPSIHSGVVFSLSQLFTPGEDVESAIERYSSPFLLGYKKCETSQDASEEVERDLSRTPSKSSDTLIPDAPQLPPSPPSQGLQGYLDSQEKSSQKRTPSFMTSDTFKNFGIDSLKKTPPSSKTKPKVDAPLLAELTSRLLELRKKEIAEAPAVVQPPTAPKAPVRVVRKKLTRKESSALGLSGKGFPAKRREKSLSDIISEAKILGSSSSSEEEGSRSRSFTSRRNALSTDSATRLKQKLSSAKEAPFEAKKKPVSSASFVDERTDVSADPSQVPEEVLQQPVDVSPRKSPSISSLDEQTDASASFTSRRNALSTDAATKLKQKLSSAKEAPFEAKKKPVSSASSVDERTDASAVPSQVSEEVLQQPVDMSPRRSPSASSLDEQIDASADPSQVSEEVLQQPVDMSPRRSPSISSLDEQIDASAFSQQDPEEVLQQPVDVSPRRSPSISSLDEQIDASAFSQQDPEEVLQQPVDVAPRKSPSDSPVEKQTDASAVSPQAPRRSSFLFGKKVPFEAKKKLFPSDSSADERDDASAVSPQAPRKSSFLFGEKVPFEAKKKLFPSDSSADEQTDVSAVSPQVPRKSPSDSSVEKQTDVSADPSQASEEALQYSVDMASVKSPSIYSTDERDDASAVPPQAPRKSALKKPSFLKRMKSVFLPPIVKGKPVEKSLPKDVPLRIISPSVEALDFIERPTEDQESAELEKALQLSREEARKSIRSGIPIGAQVRLGSITGATLNLYNPYFEDCGLNAFALTVLSPLLETKEALLNRTATEQGIITLPASLQLLRDILLVDPSSPSSVFEAYTKKIEALAGRKIDTLLTNQDRDAYGRKGAQLRLAYHLLSGKTRGNTPVPTSLHDEFGSILPEYLNISEIWKAFMGASGADRVLLKPSPTPFFSTDIDLTAREKSILEARTENGVLLAEKASLFKALTPYSEQLGDALDYFGYDGHCLVCYSSDRSRMFVRNNSTTVMVPAKQVMDENNKEYLLTGMTVLEKSHMKGYVRDNQGIWWCQSNIDTTPIEAVSEASLLVPSAGIQILSYTRLSDTLSSTA